MVKQIKDFKEQFHYSYKGMKTTLHYFYEIEHNDPADSMGVGIIPFVYEESKKFYIDRLAVKDSAKDYEEKSNKVIKVKKIKAKKTYKDLALIDIEHL